ncbi:MAG TPA: polyprenyl synthetase family protein [Candidatus Sulfotelmatobacter sp.]|nr:polyprenyl synthetase family protein [Candidatus Sulfotelmatobacter sp.]
MYNLKEFKINFDSILEEFLNSRISKFLENTSDPFIKDFVNYSKNLALAGGKRIRPYIACVMYEAMGGKDTENAMRLFISLEVVHTFALMHDDIMDKSNLRHGVPTVHAYVLEKLKELKRTGDIENVSRAQAILSGNLYFSWAMEIFLANKNFPEENIKASQNYFYKMIDEVVLGQMIDIDITTREKADSNLITEKTRLKTSRYTFVRPMQMGAALANAKHNLDDFCDSLGTKLGIAFQLQDDLLDIIGDPKILEKNILRDIVDRQHTFFTDYVFIKGSEEQKTKLSGFFGKEPSEMEAKEIIKIFQETGAIDAGKNEVIKNLDEAKIIIENSILEQEYKNICFDLVALMKSRQS